MRMLIVTGGTGGHIYPALALADQAKKHYPNIEILFVGNDDRMEATIVPEHGYPFHALHTSGLTGSVINKGKALAQMLSAYRKANKLIKEFKPDVAIGFGGYVSAPVMLAAHHQHVLCMIHEQNSVVGVANRMVSKYMDAIVICYERLFEEFPREKTRLLGNPRAQTAMQVPFDLAYYTSLGLKEDKPLILVVMGSLGSSSINEMMCECLPKVKQEYQILLVSGKKDYQTVIKQMPKQANIHVVDYVKQLDIMEKVDVLICRAGATTAAEIGALGKASIIIPSPYVANNHQFYNASVFEDAKAAFVIEEADLNAEILSKKINLVMGKDALRREMQDNARNLGFPHASDDILSWIDEMKR